MKDMKRWHPYFVDGAIEYRESKGTIPEHTINGHMKSYTQTHRSGVTQGTWQMQSNEMWSREPMPHYLQYPPSNACWEWDWGFLWGLNVWSRNTVPKPRTCLAELVMAWGQGLEGAAASDPENSVLLTLRSYGYQSQGHHVLLRYLCSLCITLLDWLAADFVPL